MNYTRLCSQPPPTASWVSQKECATITDRFGAVALPDEETGVYTGAIVWRGDHYAVQETPDGFARHDSLLFDALPGTHEAVTIRYKDNSGSAGN